VRYRRLSDDELLTSPVLPAPSELDRSIYGQDEEAAAAGSEKCHTAVGSERVCELARFRDMDRVKCNTS
jgi:hypothetical protein